MDEVMSNILARGNNFVKPINCGWLLFDVVVGRVDGKNTLASSNTF